MAQRFSQMKREFQELFQDCFRKQVCTPSHRLPRNEVPDSYALKDSACIFAACAMFGQGCATSVTGKPYQAF